MTAKDATAQTDYALIATQIEALLAGESDALANTANFVALLWDALGDINWLGVYVLRGEELVLGPFQGRPACVRIPMGQGVCGTAAARREVQRVADVHSFEGHIACDPGSKSEIVIPLVDGDDLLGVLDIDSPLPARFSTADERGLRRVCETFLKALAGQRGRAGPGFI